MSSPTNEDRAQRARNIMSAYTCEIDNGEPDLCDLRDLLADLMHMADVDTDNYEPFEKALTGARMNFEAERDSTTNRGH